MPRYKIKTLGPSFYYETETSTLFTEDGKPFEIKEELLGNGIHIYKKLVRIIMGTKCNYNCTYCSQAFSRKSIVDATVDDAKRFAEHAPNWMSDVDRIEFWGGEPLVYFKHLKVLVPALRELLPDAMFTMVSNGTLLTDEIGDFLAKYRVFFTISHDVYGQTYTRGKDPLEDPEKVACIKRTFQKINAAEAKHRGVPENCVHVCGMNTTFSKTIRDPIRVQRWFDEKFGQHMVVSCDPVLSIGEGSFNDKAQMNEDELKDLCANTFLAGLMPPGTYPYTIANKGMEFIRDLFDHLSVDKAPAFCGVTSNAITAIDLKGNVYSCQNQLQKHQILGNLFEGEVADPAFTDYRTRRHCTHCPVVMICRGGCSLSSTNKNAFVETCNTKFWYSLGLFATAFTRLTGYIPTRIEGEIVRPVKELVITKRGRYQLLNHIDLPTCRNIKF